MLSLLPNCKGRREAEKVDTTAKRYSLGEGVITGRSGEIYKIPSISGERGQWLAYRTPQQVCKYDTNVTVQWSNTGKDKACV